MQEVGAELLLSESLSGIFQGGGCKKAQVSDSLLKVCSLLALHSLINQIPLFELH